ncbi:MAG TPA: hypothetical protein VGF55_25340 [Gemmataceae bacterium]|jgi:hypothetical protein
MRRLGWIVGVAAVCGSPLRAAEPIPAGQFEKLQAVIRPTAAEEKWLQIPWRTDLTAARREAAAAGKPLLLWEMDGHPLGCT